MAKLTQAQRSGRSKDAILAAARSQFARHGYDATTIRSVAAEAGLHASMVMRYYGDKRSLFQAAVEVAEPVPDLSSVGETDRGRALMEHHLKVWEPGGVINDKFVMLLVSAGTTEVAGDEVRKNLTTRIGSVVRTVSPEAATADQRAGLIAMSLMGFSLCRYVLRLPSAVALDRESILDWMSPVIQFYLTAPAESLTRRPQTIGLPR